MKIQTVTIDNFRNLKHFVIDATNSTIISGKNKLGKSNALNALVWFFTDTIYTDNSGVGENDVNSIVPKDQVKGEHTSVSVEFVDGPTFTKTYKTGYDRATGKANKHTTEGSINNVSCKNMQEFNSKLLDVLGFSQTFTSVKELNLFIDPLYALQKLDAKQLRTLLVSFGCTATNEELFKLGFEDLRQYDNKYLGDFVNMRLDLKKQVKVIKESVTKYQILMEQFNKVEEFDESRLVAINEYIDKLTTEKAIIENSANNELIKDLEYQLKEINLSIQSEYDKKLSEINLAIKELESRKSLIRSEIESKRQQSTLEYRYELNRLNVEIANVRKSIDSFNLSIALYKNTLNTTQVAAKNAVNKKSEYQSMLVATKQRVFTGYITCPCCGESFAPDADAERQFDIQKMNDMQFYTDEINNLNESIKKYQDECKSIIKNGEDAKAEIDKLQIKLNELNGNVTNTQKLIEEINNTPVDMSELESLENQIKELNNQRLALHVDDSKALEIKEKIDAARLDSESTIKSQVAGIDEMIIEAESTREDAYIDRSNWRQKLEYQQKYQEAMEKWNDTEALIERVNDFVHTMIQVINTKAKEKTGMDFVMLEENLGNDNVKEVCYAVVDGVPFSMINTAQKYECGIKFIEKVKDIAVNDFGKPRNDLPILADKFEGIDKLEKIKTMTTEQLICTRVGLEEQITIK